MIASPNKVMIAIPLKTLSYVEGSAAKNLFLEPRQER